MEVQVRKKGNVKIVECSGTIKAGAHERLPDVMNELLVGDEHLYVFDMLKVPWSDTSGVAEIVAAHKRVTDKGGKIVLVLSQRVHDVFEITQLARVFEIYHDVDEALVSLARATEHGKQTI